MYRPTGRLLLVFAAAAWCVAGPARLASQMPAQDEGSAGAWMKILKVQTTASAMHTTAHPDDEHGGVLAMLSRGEGARLSLLTLNRGEAGDNAIGPELFDPVGLIRTEELLIADRYYGVDRQYFTTVIDYGFSKRLEEALDKWGKENVLRDVVRVIRMDRPFVLIARFQGNQRDGHGNHQTAGLITQEAYKAAGDPTVFPEQIRSGLRPWQPLKLYMGGVRENEDWTVRVDPGQYDPVLGESFQNFSREGLSFQRSQNSGRYVPTPGPAVGYYKRLASVVDAPAKETGFFDGIDTSIPGIYKALRKAEPAGAHDALAAIDREVKAAAQAFKMTEPSASAPALARALAAARAASKQLSGDPDVAFVLAVKERQLQDAIDASLGIAFTAYAQAAGTQEPTGPFAAFANPPSMTPVVPGQPFEVKATFTDRSPVPVSRVQMALDGKGNWKAQASSAGGDAAPNAPVATVFKVTVPADAPLTRPYFTRKSIQEPRYTITDDSQMYQPAADPALTAVASYEINGVRVETRRPVVRLEPNLPYGYDTHVLAVVPAIAVTLSPSQAVVPLGAADKTVRLSVSVTNNADGKSSGEVRLTVPQGWTAAPASQPFEFSHPGERAFYPFTVKAASLEPKDYRIEAVATVGGKEYREGYDVIAHRDLETRYLYKDAAAGVRGIDVKIAPGLKVGYVMGVGDDVPSGLAQLGVDVTMLGQQELATADLGKFSAIMTGTRAYAVREDLKTYNRRILDYVRNGGNLIVLYNTQEFVPNQFAPYPGDLPRNAEEVSEEDSPVDILAPNDPVFNTPNKITKADFDNWVEQRGSKFWSTWAPEYAPMIATWDKGQAPQKGGWLHAKYGKGDYTYFAYAFHRELPYGVPGAYRILANLLMLNQPAR